MEKQNRDLQLLKKVTTKTRLQRFTEQNTKARNKRG